RALELREMAGVVEDHRARVAKPAPVGDRVLGRDNAVAAPPDDQRRDLYVLELFEDLVAHEALDGRQEARPAGPVVELLQQQLSAQELGMLEQPLEGGPAQPGTAHPPPLEA